MRKAKKRSETSIESSSRCASDRSEMSVLQTFVMEYEEWMEELSSKGEVRRRRGEEKSTKSFFGFSSVRARTINDVESSARSHYSEAFEGTRAALTNWNETRKRFSWRLNCCHYSCCSFRTWKKGSSRWVKRSQLLALEIMISSRWTLSSIAVTQVTESSSWA